MVTSSNIRGGGQRLELWLLKSREIRGAGALPTRQFLLASETTKGIGFRHGLTNRSKVAVAGAGKSRG